MPNDIQTDPVHFFAAFTAPKKTLETDMNLTVLTRPVSDFTTPDFEAIKSKQNAAWSSVDYGKVGVTLQITGEELAEAADPAPGSSVLDVAAGNGNATLAFARRCCEVTSTDYVESLLESGRKRAEAEGLYANFQTADAEDLPFAESSFDLVVSTFGVMFAPNQQKAAAEMTRVCRSGGKIAMANWTPDSFVGALFKTLGRHVPPPAGVSSPTLWGNQDWIERQFISDARDITMKLKSFNFRYHSPAHFIEFFSTFYGPVHKAFQALDKAGRMALREDILETVAHFNLATDGSMIVPSQYAEIIVTRR